MAIVTIFRTLVYFMCLRLMSILNWTGVFMMAKEKGGYDVQPASREHTFVREDARWGVYWRNADGVCVPVSDFAQIYLLWEYI